MSSHLHTKACCIIDDNPAKLGRFIDGVPIVGDRNDIPEMVEKLAEFSKEEVIAKFISAEFESVNKYYQGANDLNVSDEPA